MNKQRGNPSLSFQGFVYQMICIGFSMNNSMKDEIRQLSQQCEKFKENLNGVLKEVEKREKEDKKLKKDEIKIQSEKAELIPQIADEEENLKLKLKQVKTKLGSFTKDSVGM